MTREIDPAATGQEPFKWLYRIYKVACQAPAKISTRAELPSSPATVLHRANQLPAKTGGGSALPPPKRYYERRGGNYVFLEKKRFASLENVV